MKYIFFLFSIITFGQNQKFIPLDEETLEFLTQVNYTLYTNKKPIYTNITSKDSVTRLPNNITFDSISFNKLNFKDTGLKKEKLNEVVLLSKKVFELDEIILLNTKQKELIVGEQSRFIKKSSKSLTKNVDSGLLFQDFELKNRLLNKLIFFVEKVKHKTIYKIKFYSAEEIGNPLSFQTLKLGDILFESPILTLEKGTKNKVEVNLDEYYIDLDNKNIFVTIELQEYFDENNNQIQPNSENKTKLKFQTSKKINYYSKLADFYTNELTKELININVKINYDFAYQLFEKPHKSILVAPAILLITTMKK